MSDDDWERLADAILAIDEPGGSERHRVWWELRDALSDALPLAEFRAFLCDMDEPLKAYLAPPPAPRMAFDEMPEPKTLALFAEVFTRLANGEYEQSGIEKARRFAERMLRTTECEIRPGSHSNNAVRAFMRRRVAEWPDHEPAPTEAKDVMALLQEFPSLTRSEARIVRADETPLEWRRQGPRRPWGRRRR